MSGEARQLSLKLTDKELVTAIEAMVEASGALEALLSVCAAIDPATAAALSRYRGTLDFLVGAFMADRASRRALSTALRTALGVRDPAAPTSSGATAHPQVDEVRSRVFDDWPEMLWNSNGAPPRVVAPSDGSEPTPVLREANQALREWSELADKLLRDAQVLAREVDRLKGAT